MANAKKITAHTDTGKTVYAVITREADGYLLNDADGTFAAAPADPYLSLSEHATIKGRYDVSESRTAWNDGRYIVTVYRQAGGTPVPASDTVAGTGEMKIESDAEVTEITKAEIEASDILAKQAKLDFVEKWILNKLVESPTGTWKLYDDDDVTVLKTWTWDSSTRTRSRAV